MFFFNILKIKIIDLNVYKLKPNFIESISTNYSKDIQNYSKDTQKIKKNTRLYKKLYKKI